MKLTNYALKLTRAAFVVVGMMVWPGNSFAQDSGQNCADIESAVARLECYDRQAAEREPVPTRTPGEIFNELAALATFFGRIEHAQVAHAHSFDDCTFITERYSHQYTSDRGALRMAIGGISGDHYTVNLRMVDQSQSRPDGSAYIVVMVRGATTQRIKGGDRRHGPTADIYGSITDVRAAVREALIGGDPRRLVRIRPSVIRDRTLFLPVTPVAHKEDGGKITALFTELIAACQAES